jgi:hypothetical protein
VFTCCEPELKIGDDYNGGATFMMFLAARFGEDIHARLLRSSADTIWAALSEATKPYSRPELYSQFQQLLVKGAPPK